MSINYKKISRELAISQGAYDGRFKQKVVVDKKKNDNKMKCRSKEEY